MAAVSRRLVIDTSVASAAGAAMHDDSRRCREFLQAVLQISHRAAMTPLLRNEWKRHQSLFAARWLAEMTSKRKVDGIADIPHEALREEAPARKSVQKDLYLVEAALTTDKIAISLDELARTELALPSTAEVMWVNPVKEGGHVIYWLRNGAEPVEEWKLGRY
jgi:hypothetical protein